MQLVKVFIKAQMSAFLGGMFDYCVMIFCTEYLHIHYTFSIVIGGILGAIVNFSINKYWTYNDDSKNIQTQLFKFYLVVAGSILLKTLGTYVFTEALYFDYKISRIVVDLFVSIGFNFMLQRFWVFKPTKNGMHNN